MLTGTFCAKEAVLRRRKAESDRVIFMRGGDRESGVKKLEGSKVRTAEGTSNAHNVRLRLKRKRERGNRREV
jgi:hypothetical protein